jgi:hypothetical protein
MMHAAFAAMLSCHHASSFRNNMVSPARRYKPETLRDEMDDKDSHRLKADASSLRALLNDLVTISSVTVTEFSENQGQWGSTPGEGCER